ncbi:hypothetical protein SAMN04487968_10962 [Nocardioides terrae]|uniref:Intracellular septation protein A n=1 Tax=Nocardioides terrae TaxID=574651 RepID=A0A1I1KY05_9ACTN|nr:hypothetical protein [Nocardioides terrae]SFC65689.1 hypothetical protein SAMN04487968_10962 [Nocardioides terrae]
MIIRPVLVSGATPPVVVDEPAVIHLGRLRSVLVHGLLLVGEVVVIPGALLYALVVAGHPMLGLVSVLLWRVGCIGTRLGGGSRVPATCWLAFGLFLTRTVAGLVGSSVGLYLLVPTVLCAAQGLFFLGSSLTKRPAMMRLATDYAGQVPDHPGLRRLFAQLSSIWGGVHLVCACAGAWAITLSTSQAVALTSGLGVACTVTSIGGCVGWGVWRAARIPGLRIVCGERPVASPPRVDVLPAAA